MKKISYSTFLQELNFYLDEVKNNHTPFYIEFTDGEDVVVLSKSYFESMEDTFHLLKSPANVARLLQSIEDYKNGLGKERNLIEE